MRGVNNEITFQRKRLRLKFCHFHSAKKLLLKFKLMLQAEFSLKQNNAFSDDLSDEVNKLEVSENIE